MGLDFKGLQHMYFKVRLLDVIGAVCRIKQPIQKGVVVILSDNMCHSRITHLSNKHISDVPLNMAL